jgi:hypothetical protein
VATARERYSRNEPVPAGARPRSSAAGPELLAGVSHFFGSFTAGPTTTGLTTGAVGFSAMLSVGGAM